MTPPPDDEPVSFLRILEFILAVGVITTLAAAWAYSWLKTSLLVALWWFGG